MTTTKRADIVVAWEIVGDEAPPEPRRHGGSPQPANAPAPYDHCPACASRLVERTFGEAAPEIRCLSCARIWAIEGDGLRLRTRIIVDP